MAKTGFILLHRVFCESEIMDKPPHFRDIWIFLLLGAAWKKCKRKGRIIKRGQLITSYGEIIEALSWHVGKRIGRYKKTEIECAFRFYKKSTMASTAKSTGGMIVTILNYDKYQPKIGYEVDSEVDTEVDTGGVVPYIEEVISNNYRDIDFPNGFPINNFATWEYERSKERKNPKMTQTMRKTALTQILGAMKRNIAFRGIGYNSVSELLEHAADNRWRGFSWLNAKLNAWENSRKTFKAERDGQGRPQPPAFKPEMLR